MGRYTKAKVKLMRREGLDLGLKGAKTLSDKSPLKRKPQPPGQHGFGNKRLSDYGLQLREKQKVKRMYGLLEKQFRLYYKKAEKFTGVTGSVLLSFLEKRLDNVVYRAGIAPTRAFARKMIGNKKVFVNSKRVITPSYQVREKDVITFDPDFLVSVGEDYEFPSWISFDKAKNSVKIVSSPKREDISDAINEQMIIEFYSR